MNMQVIRRKSSRNEKGDSPIEGVSPLWVQRDGRITYQGLLRPVNTLLDGG